MNNNGKTENASKKKYTLYKSKITLHTDDKITLQKLNWPSFFKFKRIILEMPSKEPIPTTITEATPYLIKTINDEGQTNVLFRRNFNHKWRAWNRIPSFNESQAENWC